MPKQKPHKGLLKRVKITATGKVKFRAAFNGHLRSKKTGSKIRSLRLKKIAKPGDVVRFEGMLHRPLA
jgi:ribosomal protein L35